MLYLLILSGNITQEEALDRGVDSLRNFMFRQTQEKDLALLVSFTDLPVPKPEVIFLPMFSSLLLF